MLVYTEEYCLSAYCFPHLKYKLLKERVAPSNQLI